MIPIVEQIQVTLDHMVEEINQEISYLDNNQHRINPAVLKVREDKINNRAQQITTLGAQIKELIDYHKSAVARAYERGQNHKENSSSYDRIWNREEFRRKWNEQRNFD